jgi:aminoglycoside phosphotransferase (APT) family kinase protein
VADVAVHAWTAEWTVDAGLAARLIATAVPELADRPVEKLSTGWDSTVFKVGSDLTFRFPRREVVLPGIERELCLLPLVAAHVELAVPAPLYVCRDVDGFPWPFVGAAFIPGLELAESRWLGSDAADVAGAAGSALRQLHSPDLAKAVHRDGVVAVPVDPNGRCDTPSLLPRLGSTIQRLSVSGVWEPTRAIRSLFASARELDVPDEPPVITHGDLHLRHLLVDPKQPRATGLIDWIDISLNDPAVDLQLAFSAFDGEAREAFFDAYGQIDDERELRARAVALHLSTMLLEYAAAEGLDSLAAAVRASFARITT